MFATALGAMAYSTGSELAFAQASDSLLDVAGALVLGWAVALGQEPRDDDHPMGHTRAEALGALLIAGLAALLSFEVAQSAVLALIGHEEPRLAGLILVAFAVKAVVKFGIWWAARHGRGPALEALAVDARNDVLTGLVAVSGFLLARYGWPALDSWLALPLAAWIGWSGFVLARENVARLMGAAPAQERQEELLGVARAVPGVLAARHLRAQHLGEQLSVQIDVEVEGHLSVHDGHRIAEAVRVALEAESDVLVASVLVVPATPLPASSTG